MIFNKSFDKSLRLMIASNEGDIILNFISILPADIYVFICDMIAKNEEYISFNDNNKCSFLDFGLKRTIATDGFIYEFRSGIEFGKLVVRIYRYDEYKKIEENVELHLSGFNGDIFFDTDTVDIGSFSYDSKITNLFDGFNKHDSYRRSFEIKRMPLNRLMVRVKELKFGLGRVITLDSISNEIYINNIAEIKKKNNLIRKR